MKFVIDRKTWRRGGNNHSSELGNTLLLNNKGYMCCLGQIALQCGVPEDEIFEKGTPNAIPVYYNNYRALLVNEDTRPNILACEAMNINDDTYIKDAEREQKLIELFASHGHELEFVS